MCASLVVVVEYEPSLPPPIMFFVKRPELWYEFAFLRSAFSIRHQTPANAERCSPTSTLNKERNKRRRRKRKKKKKEEKKRGGGGGGGWRGGGGAEREERKENRASHYFHCPFQCESSTNSTPYAANVSTKSTLHTFLTACSSTFLPERSASPLTPSNYHHILIHHTASHRPARVFIH